MKVDITLYGNLGYYLPEGSARYSLSRELAEKTTVRALMRSLNFPDEIPVIAVVNGMRVDRDHVLKDGDKINFFRPTGGG